MQADLIIIREYCEKMNVESSFFNLLEENGLITIYVEEGESYFASSQLCDLEKYIRLHYDLSISIEGIDVIRNLQDKIDQLQHEVVFLRDKLRVYETDFFDD